MSKAQNRPVDESGKLIPMKQADPVLRSFLHVTAKDDQGNIWHGPGKVFRDGTCQIEVKEMGRDLEGNEIETVKGVALSAGSYTIQDGE